MNTYMKLIMIMEFVSFKYSETSIHHFRWGSEKETMDPGKQ
jgi:hypothetical protein